MIAAKLNSFLASSGAHGKLQSLSSEIQSEKFQTRRRTSEESFFGAIVRKEIEETDFEDTNLNGKKIEI